MKKENIEFSDLKAGKIIEFKSEHLKICNEVGNELVYEHAIFGDRGPIIPQFLSTHHCRTPFVIESIKDDVVNLRSVTAVCNSDGNLLKGRQMNLRAEVTRTMLFDEHTGHSHGYIFALYDNVCECIEAQGGNVHKEGCIEHEVALTGSPERFCEIVEKMLETYIRKNHDYGNAFSEMYDELGINYGYGKIREKVNRIKTLKDGDAMVENEPLEDALLDCANYCILTLIEYQKHKENGK